MNMKISLSMCFWILPAVIVIAILLEVVWLYTTTQRIAHEASLSGLDSPETLQVGWRTSSASSRGSRVLVTYKRGSEPITQVITLVEDKDGKGCTGTYQKSIGFDLYRQDYLTGHITVSGDCSRSRSQVCESATFDRQGKFVKSSAGPHDQTVASRSLEKYTSMIMHVVQALRGLTCYASHLKCPNNIPGTITFRQDGDVSICRDQLIANTLYDMRSDEDTVILKFLSDLEMVVVHGDAVGLSPGRNLNVSISHHGVAAICLCVS